MNLEIIMVGKCNNLIRITKNIIKINSIKMDTLKYEHLKSEIENYILFPDKYNS